MANANDRPIEYCDEYGRPTDERGNLTTQLVPEHDAVQIGENLMEAGLFADLREHCERYTDEYAENVSLWRLQGIANASTGNAMAARMSFLTALQFDPLEPYTLANCVVSCIDAGDKGSAFQLLEQVYGELDGDGRKVVLMALLKTVRAGLLTEEELPAVIRDEFG